MTRKHFQKLCISIGCPPKEARNFKLPMNFSKEDAIIVKTFLKYDMESYQGCWEFILHMIEKYDDWYESMGWNEAMFPYKHIFHWSRGRRASFSIDDAYVNKEILEEYVYPQT